MTRARYVLFATLVGASLVADATLAAQAAQAPPMTPILSGKTFTPPVRGVAEVQSSKPVIKREKGMVITTFQVRNASDAPIARLTIDETWYDKAGTALGGGKAIIPGLLKPGEVQAVTLETPWKLGMASNNYQFTHANGTVKAARVDKLEGADEAAKAAAGTKKP